MAATPLPLCRCSLDHELAYCQNPCGLMENPFLIADAEQDRNVSSIFRSCSSTYSLSGELSIQLILITMRNAIVPLVGVKSYDCSLCSLILGDLGRFACFRWAQFLWACCYQVCGNLMSMSSISPQNSSESRRFLDRSVANGPLCYFQPRIINSNQFCVRCTITLYDGGNSWLSRV